MSLFKSVKKALGFPEDYNDDLDDIADLEDVDDDDYDLSSTDVDNNIGSDKNVISTKLVSDEFVLNLAEDIVKIFGSDQPDKALLITSVSTILAQNLPFVAEMGRQQAENSYLRERAPLVRELNELKKRTSDIDTQREHYEVNRLNNERQKRALNDKIEDFQKQILILEAEHEQLLLENKYMADKIRGIMPPDTTPTAAQNSGYKQLAAENTRLQREIDNLRAKLLEVSDIDIEKFQNEFEEQVNQLEDKLKSKDEEIRALRQDNGQLSLESQKLNSRVIVDDEKINALEIKVAELHKTIQTNLFDHAAEEEKLQNEIKRLTTSITKKESNNIDSSKGRKAAKTQKTDAEPLAIDELMDSTDWFAAPEPGPRHKDPEVTENFGYKNQLKKKTQKTDDNQLTLF